MALNENQEKFCAGIVKGQTKKQAYIEAFPGCSESSAAVMASKLSKNPEIMARIADLKTTVRNDTNVDIHRVVDELEEARQEARKAGSPNLMMKASMLKAQLLGFVGDDTQTGLGPGLSVGSLKLEIGDLKSLKNELDNE